MTNRIIEALKIALRIDEKEVKTWLARARIANPESPCATTDAKNTTSGMKPWCAQKKL